MSDLKAENAKLRSALVDAIRAADNEALGKLLPSLVHKALTQPHPTDEIHECDWKRIFLWLHPEEEWKDTLHEEGCPGRGTKPEERCDGEECRCDGDEDIETLTALSQPKPPSVCECCGCTGDVSPLGVYLLMVGKDSKALHCQDCYLAWYDTTEIDPKKLREYVLATRAKSKTERA